MAAKLVFFYFKSGYIGKFWFIFLNIFNFWHLNF